MSGSIPFASSLVENKDELPAGHAVNAAVFAALYTIRALLVPRPS